MNSILKLSPVAWRLLKTITICLCFSMLGFLTKYFYNFVFAHLLTTPDYSHYVFITSTITLLATIFLIGNSETCVKWLPSYFKEISWGKAHGLTLYYLYFIALIGLISFLTWAVLTGSFHYFHITLSENSLWRYLWLVPFLMGPIFLQNLLCALNRPYAAVIAYPSMMHATVLLVVYVAWLFFRPFTVLMAIECYALAVCIIFIFQSYIAWFSLPVSIFTVPPIWTIKEWVSGGVSLLIIRLIFICEVPILLLVLKLTWKDETAIGVFNVVVTLSRVMWITATACFSVFGHSIAPAAEQHDTQKLQKINNISGRIMFGFGLVVFIVFVFFGKTLLRHFGDNYVVGYIPLLIVSAATLVPLLAGMTSRIVEFAIEPMLLFKVAISTTVYALVFGAFLCHYYGLYGAALMFVVVETGFPLAYGILMRVKLGIRILGVI